MTVSRWAAYEPTAERLPDPVDLVIRPAGPPDCAAIARIEAMRDALDVDVARLACERQLEDRDVLILVALVGGEVAGFGRAGRIRLPPGSPPDSIPDGWYLLGVIVADRWRRRGIARELTRRRLDWIAERSAEAWYFANARNSASLDLHAELGFGVVSRRFSAPRLSFEGGEGVLCRIDLATRHPSIEAGDKRDDRPFER